MDAKPHPPAQWGSAGPALLHDDTIRSAHPGRACCCPAKAVVQVIMPPTATRHREVDLLLCGHHHHVSRKALAAADAEVSWLPRA